MEFEPNFSPESNKKESLPEKEREKDNELEEIEGKLEKKEKNSEKLKIALEVIDEHFFPENNIETKVLKDIKKGRDAMHYFEKDELGDYKEHYYAVNESLDKKESKLSEERYLNSLLGVAIHEVRHRLQHDKENLSFFTRENIKNLEKKSKALQYLKDKTGEGLKEMIETRHEDEDDKLSENDYDAVAIETLAVNLLNKDIPLSKVVEDIIGENAEEVIQNLDKIIDEI